MKIGIICGSHRPASQSVKIARFIERALIGQSLCEETWLLELAHSDLPFWEEGAWDGDNNAWQEHLQPLREQLNDCDGFVVVSPEWHGMVPARLKNFFLMWTAGGELAHKPALIVTTSASTGGSYPVAELRSSSYKNSRICYLPEHLIVRNVKSVFNDRPQDNDEKAQDYLEARLSYCLTLLREYALAFRQVRASGATSLGTYGTGM
ncbi:MAG: NADPH-dependent FMN reductase [Parahaliea sp.]